MTLLGRSLALVCLFATLGVANPAVAQDTDQSLADIRQELAVLSVELKRLTRELSTSGGVNVQTGGSTVLQRVDLIEAELARLTAKTEQMENRINRVVLDGTNRVGDLEFRLCELEAACDVGNMPELKPLGGEEVTAASPAVAPNQPAATDGPQLAVSEQADFDRAKEALESGSFQSAVDQFATYAEAYPDGPLVQNAHLLRGEALAQLGDTSNAARAYLESFSANPEGASAPEALFKLGASLGTLGQVNEACITLGEVGARFPTATVVASSQAEMAKLSCS